MKTHNYIMATIFGVLGLACLFAAIFLGATHQLLMAAIGIGMSIALISEVKRKQKQS